MAAIEADGMAIEFPLYHHNARSLKQRILASTPLRLKRDDDNRIVVAALRDLTFSIGNGERVALVGPNGAGKTTLLRTIAGVYEPVAGSLRVAGEIGSLIDPAAGMDPLLTGRENVVLRALYRGMTEADGRALAEEVRASPASANSSTCRSAAIPPGMNVRLSFAMATAMTPEILLMDEWFLAGDADFMARADERLSKLVTDAEILMIATHDMAHRAEMVHPGDPARGRAHPGRRPGGRRCWRRRGCSDGGGRARDARRCRGCAVRQGRPFAWRLAATAFCRTSSCHQSCLQRRAATHRASVACQRSSLSRPSCNRRRRSSQASASATMSAASAGPGRAGWSRSASISAFQPAIAASAWRRPASSTTCTSKPARFSAAGRAASAGGSLRSSAASQRASAGPAGSPARHQVRAARSAHPAAARLPPPPAAHPATRPPRSGSSISAWWW